MTMKIIGIAKHHKAKVFAIAAILVLFATVGTAIFMAHANSKKTMDALQNEIKTKWVDNSAWQHGSRDDFQKLFGNPDLFDEDDVMLYYQCRDGILIVCVYKTSPDFGPGAFEISTILRVKDWSLVHKKDPMPVN